MLTRDDAALLLSMLPFYQHPNVMRRGGVISVVKYATKPLRCRQGSAVPNQCPGDGRARAALHLQELLL